MKFKYLSTSLVCLSVGPALAQTGNGTLGPAGSSAPGQTQSIPAGTAPVPGATAPTATPNLPQTSPLPYPSLPNQYVPPAQDSSNSGLSPFQGVPPTQRVPGRQYIPGAPAVSGDPVRDTRVNDHAPLTTPTPPQPVQR